MGYYDKYCKHCGEKLGWHLQSNAVFCDNECRDAWHAQERKLKRRIKRQHDLTTEIARDSHVTGNQLLAMYNHTLQQIMASGRYYCAECGEQHRTVPYTGEWCETCERAAWEFEPRK